MLFSRDQDLALESIAERVRAVVSRQPGRTLRIAADALEIPALDLARLLDTRERPVDRMVVIDVVTALVHEAGVDPRWLLTGEYDGSLHREALLLGEDRGARGRNAVRAFVEHQYRALKRDALLAWRPWRRAARSHQTTPKINAKTA